MSFGSSKTQKVEHEIPEWVESASKDNLSKADVVAKIAPSGASYGPTVAAFTPQQRQAMQATSNTAYHMGLSDDPNIYLREAEIYPDGTRGYSSRGLYDQMIGRLRREQPGTYAGIMGLFDDPYAAPTPGMSETTPTSPTRKPKSRKRREAEGRTSTGEDRGAA